MTKKHYFRYFKVKMRHKINLCDFCIIKPQKLEQEVVKLNEMFYICKICFLKGEK